MYTTYGRPVIFLRTIWISLIVGRKLVKNARICKLNNQTQELKNSIIASQFDEVCIKQLNYKTFVPVKIPFFQDKTENFIQQIISNPWAQFEEWNVSQPIKIHSVIKVRDRLKVLVVFWVEASLQEITFSHREMHAQQAMMLRTYERFISSFYLYFVFRVVCHISSIDQLYTKVKYCSFWF